MKKLLFLFITFLIFLNTFQTSAQKCVAGDCQNGYGISYFQNYSETYTIETCFNNSSPGSVSSTNVPIIYRYKRKDEIFYSVEFRYTKVKKSNSDEFVSKVDYHYEPTFQSYSEYFEKSDGTEGTRYIKNNGKIEVLYRGSSLLIDEKNTTGVTPKDAFEQRLIEIRQLFPGYNKDIVDLAEKKNYEAVKVKIDVDFGALNKISVFNNNECINWTEKAFKLQDNKQLADAAIVWNQIYLKCEDIDKKLNAIGWKSHCEEDLGHYQIAIEDLKKYEKLYEKAGKSFTSYNYKNCVERIADLYKKVGNQKMSDLYSQKKENAKNGIEAKEIQINNTNAGSIRFGKWNVYGKDIDGSFSKRNMNYFFYNNGSIEMTQTETIDGQYAKGKYVINGSSITINWNAGTTQKMTIVNSSSILPANASALKIIFSE